MYQFFQNIFKKEPQAPPSSSDRVVYSDILHFPPKTEQHPPSYDDIEPSIPSVTIIPANEQDNDIPPPIPAKTYKTSDTLLASTTEKTGYHDEESVVQITYFFVTPV